MRSNLYFISHLFKGIIEEASKPKKAAILHQKTPRYGPALPVKSTRVVTGNDTAYNCTDHAFSCNSKQIIGKEKEKLLANLNSKDEDAISLLRRDLADSSDEEDNRNPMEQKYNDYGREVKRKLGEG